MSCSGYSMTPTIWSTSVTNATPAATPAKRQDALAKQRVRELRDTTFSFGGLALTRKIVARFLEIFRASEYGQRVRDSIKSKGITAFKGIVGRKQLVGCKCPCVKHRKETECDCELCTYVEYNLGRLRDSRPGWREAARKERLAAGKEDTSCMCQIHSVEAYRKRSEAAQMAVSAAKAAASLAKAAAAVPGAAPGVIAKVNDLEKTAQAAQTEATSASKALTEALSRTARYDLLAQSTDHLLASCIPCGMELHPDYTKVGEGTFKSYRRVCCFDPRNCPRGWGPRSFGCGWDAFGADCPDECNDKPFSWKDWEPKLRGINDEGKETYFPEFVPKHGTRRQFFAELRAKVKEWMAHQYRIKWTAQSTKMYEDKKSGAQAAAMLDVTNAYRAARAAAKLKMDALAIVAKRLPTLASPIAVATADDPMEEDAAPPPPRANGPPVARVDAAIAAAGEAVQRVAAAAVTAAETAASTAAAAHSATQRRGLDAERASADGSRLSRDGGKARRAAITRVHTKLVEHHGKSGCDGNSNGPKFTIKAGIKAGTLMLDPGTRDLVLFLAQHKCYPSIPKSKKRGWEAVGRIFYGFMNTDLFSRFKVPEAKGWKDCRGDAFYAGHNADRALAEKGGWMQARKLACSCNACGSCVRTAHLRARFLHEIACVISLPSNVTDTLSRCPDLCFTRLSTSMPLRRATVCVASAGALGGIDATELVLSRHALGSMNCDQAQSARGGARKAFAAVNVLWNPTCRPLGRSRCDERAQTIIFTQRLRFFGARPYGLPRKAPPSNFNPRPTKIGNRHPGELAELYQIR